MELKTSIESDRFEVQILGLSGHNWDMLKLYGFDKMPLYWAETGHSIVLSHIVGSVDMRMEFRPMGHHSAEDGHRFVVRKLRTIAEIIRKLELNGIPSRFDWVKEQLPNIQTQTMEEGLIPKMRGTSK